MTRAFNFCAGPAALPEEVLQQARDELLDWQGTGMSIMEMSHRSKEYVAIAHAAEQDLRELLGISNDYAVLFLQGGASQQFSMIPMNLLNSGETADYVNTGQWSIKAIAEAKRFGNINVVASAEDKHFSYVPAQSSWNESKDAVYLHYTPNETIGGVEFPFIPKTDKPLVADFSSSILSRPLDVDRYGLIYAGAQKNIGPAGIVVVIIRRDLIGRVTGLPAMLDYKIHADNGSMYNTPPTYSWYLAGLVFKWLKRQGGLAAMAEVNDRKAKKLYGYIDASEFYSNPVNPADRSCMNVPFVLADALLDKQFLQQADAAGLLNLAGHRSVGGMRASIYNAVPEAAVDALIEFMQDFAKRNG
ncbi:3-phosphoserine/phosphohydroxythreonine transaminase [Alcanivorax sp. 1008]|uniref:3-phosphoserine/phosphohydroxythreonine transaminase n=1 Tax=Alcanivorax sp. 1008 TaxID=2816853 RepID=UPI001D96BE83|nr:3-phosphoserine/phosphohydroxythreonine transaminase [Alcanivorax sp. 1008]MCC1495722.1 3-phosphoserine/phosphohydroxythreonine transaminase [Alcanivorax sp. 1008]